MHHRAWVCPFGSQVAVTKTQMSIRRKAQQAEDGHPSYTHLCLARPELKMEPEKLASTVFIDQDGNTQEPFKLEEERWHLYADCS